MKRKYLGVLLLTVSCHLGAQSNTFPATGNVGIGTNSPRSALDVSGGSTSAYSIETMGLWNVALASTVTISGGALAGGGPTKRGDGSLWHTTAIGQWIMFDLGSAPYVNIAGVGFGTHWRLDSRFTPAGYTIEVSIDGSSWTNYATATGNTSVSVMHYGGGYWRYVRITVTAFQSGYSDVNIAGVQILTDTRGALAGGELWGQNINTNDVFFTGTGNIGIGTTTPLNKLDVLGNSHSTLGGRNILGDDGNYNPIVRQYRWTGGGANYYPSTITTTGDGGGIPTLKFQVGSSYSPIGTESLIDVMTLKGTGNVGIGTTAPGYTLDVNGNFGVARIYARGPQTASFPTYSFEADTNTGMWGGNDDTLRFSTAGVQRVHLDASGNVGIGTTNPAARLNIVGTYGTSGGGGDIYVSAENSYVGVDAGVSRMGLVKQWGNYPVIGADSATPIIFGNFATTNLLGQISSSTAFSTRMIISTSGNVGIGTTTPTHRLSVNGAIRAKEVIVDTGWADYVFADNYRLAPLSEIESQIKTEKHLPGIPTATEIAEHGVSIGEMQARMLAKIEELTLHVIALKKENDALKTRLLRLESATTP